MKWFLVDIWAVPIGLILLAISLPAGAGIFAVVNCLLSKLAIEELNKWQVTGALFLMGFCFVRASCWSGIFKKSNESTVSGK